VVPGSVDLGTQPLLGLAACALIVSISLAAAIAAPPAALVGWIGLTLTAFVPALIVQAVVRKTDGRTQQPGRGAQDLAEVALVGAASLILAITIYAPDRASASPYVLMPLIASVPITLWLVFLLEGWPVRAFAPRARRLAILAMTACLAAIGDRYLADYGATMGRAVRDAVVVPRGMFDVRGPVTLLVTSAAAVMALQGLDFWPIAMLARRVRLAASQPWRGLCGLGVALGVAGAAQWVGGQWFGIAIGRFQARIGVSFLFGMFVMLVLFQGRLFVDRSQPTRGALIAASAGLIAWGAYPLYRLAGLAAQALHGGAVPVDPDAWIATAMLAVTFPAMALWADIFDFWPLRRAW
jgi:hypothetical protein